MLPEPTTSVTDFIIGVETLALAALLVAGCRYRPHTGSGRSAAEESAIHRGLDIRPERRLPPGADGGGAVLLPGA